MRTVLPSIAPARYRAAGGAGDDYGISDQPDWREIDWGSHLEQMEIDGRSVNYVDIGDQGEHRPIVFIHGLSGQWQNWLENIPRFSRQRRVVAMDLPGFGLSEIPRERISIELYGRSVAELCERLDLAPVVVVGNSMGGFVAAEVATRRPEIVERLMLLSSAGVSQMDVAKGPVLVAGKVAGLLATSNVAQMRMTARRPKLRHWVMSLVCRHPSRIKADVMFEGLMKGANKPGFESALRACLEYDFRERLPDIGCPAIVVWGEKDMIISVGDADKFVSLVPGARKVIFEDTGHVPMVERPKSFNDCLEEFLSYEVKEGELEGELEGEAVEAPTAISATVESIPAPTPAPPAEPKADAAAPEPEPEPESEAEPAPEPEPQPEAQPAAEPEPAPEPEPEDQPADEAPEPFPAPPWAEASGSAPATTKRKTLSRFRGSSGTGAFITSQGHCAVCQKPFMAGSQEALDLSGWRVNGDVGLCPKDQSEGWELPEQGRRPFRRGRS